VFCRAFSDLKPARSASAQERNGGNYGSGTQELQRRNYIERKEARFTAA
jgi:hypothetical protein